ncbi:hypothetical protein LOTGIDRAFT_235453 [Lottia gigantea]|uniref:Uncharacterized protein n=1 Tax=Lottia gigantea TaxID=225164 RepID=V3ZZJ5_LOTGI|nr:hypothetical protein LOTGIDRAFT_235453 [Lottia gigantea]ESO86411.1 hypothetical protein LOTGIDRAFT_235453 [Lottia gigantea]
MGNSLTVSEPYIVDDLNSDDDDDYYSAYETGYSDTEPAENKENLKAPAAVGRQISVDAAVVSKLVSEVEVLMSHLNEQNYDAAYNAALNLQQGGVGTFDENGLRRNKSSIPISKSPKKHDKQAYADNMKNESLQARRSNSEGENSDELISDELLKSSDNLCEGIIPEITMTSAPGQRTTSHSSNHSGSDNSEVFMRGKGGKSSIPNGDGLGNLSNDLDSGEGDNTLAWEIDVGDFQSNNDTKSKSAGLNKVRRWIDSDIKYDDNLSPAITATSDQIAQRKILDQKRWNCISRPQIPKACGISSLVSCWNYLFSTLGNVSCWNYLFSTLGNVSCWKYLFSTLGNDSLAPLSQEEALRILGFKQPYSEIKFGPFTGNATLLRWFRELNHHFKVKGRCFFTYKPVGKNATAGVTSRDALYMLKKGLHDPNSAFIYHCFNHFFCPIGYEDTPMVSEDAYKGLLPQDKVQTWILIGESNAYQPSIHSKKWSDISTDLNNENPTYLDIRRLWKGQQTRQTIGGNLHCIMAFQKVNLQPRRSQLPVRKSGSTGDRSPMRSTGHREPVVFSGQQEDEQVFEDERNDSGDEIYIPEDE